MTKGKYDSQSASKENPWIMEYIQQSSDILSLVDELGVLCVNSPCSWSVEVRNIKIEILSDAALHLPQETSSPCNIFTGFVIMFRRSGLVHQPRPCPQNYMQQ